MGGRDFKGLPPSPHRASAGRVVSLGFSLPTPPTPHSLPVLTQRAVGRRRLAPRV